MFRLIYIKNNIRRSSDYDNKDAAIIRFTEMSKEAVNFLYSTFHITLYENDTVIRQFTLTALKK